MSATLTPLPSPITRRTAGKHYVWGADLEIARTVAEQFGGEVLLTDADHQVAKLKANGVTIVVYPHRTSAGNYHLRVRDEGSKDKRRADEVMDALDKAAGFNCTFSRHFRPFAKDQSQ